MRQIYTSPRYENVERVVALLSAANIATTIRNRRDWQGGQWKRFSYTQRGESEGWAQVWVTDSNDQTRAREILRLLGETSANLPAGAREEIEQFKVEDDALHYVVIIFNSPDIDLNQNKIIVSDYNDKYHKLDRLRISNIYLGTDAESRLPLLVLRRFKDKADAMKYYTGIQKNSKDFIPSNVGHEIFPVTQNNYREILKEKSVDNYRAFFQLNYLK